MTSTTQDLADAMVTVTGRGTVSAAADIARLQLSCQAQHPTVQEAIDATSVAVSRVREVLGQWAIEQRDAPTGRIAVSTHEVWENGASRIAGYTAEHRLTVTVRELDTVGQVIADVVDAAGDTLRIHGIEFAVENETALAVAARDIAFADARDVASQYAEAADRSLGAVLEIVEGARSDATPLPKGRAVAFAAMDSAESVPVEPGAQDVTATVRVTWQLV